MASYYQIPSSEGPGSLSPGDFFIFSHLLGDFHDAFEITLGLANGFDGLMVNGDMLELDALSSVGHDIFDFHLRVGRQDDIRIQGIVFQPGVLDYDRFNLGTSVSVDSLISAVPAGGPAGIVAPQHMDFRTAVFLGDRIFIFLKLVFYGSFNSAAP
jgi:hypothetical protein